MAQERYLSTDPNAGDPIAGGGGYLSTDPNAGGAPTSATTPEHPAAQMGLMRALLNFASEMMQGNPRGMGAAGEILMRNNPQDMLPAAGAAVGGAMGAPGIVTAGGGAALGGAAGESVKQLIDRAVGRQGTPSTPLEAVKDIALEGGTQGGAQLVGGAVAPALARGGARLMQSALKPRTAQLHDRVSTPLAGRIPAVVQTMLDEGVNVTRSGLEKVERIIGTVNASIDDAVRNALGSIRPIDVASRLNDTMRTASTQVNPVRDQTAVRRAAREFLETFKIPMSPAQAQRVKVGTYKSIAGSYGEMGSAQIESQKALARGLREEIERAVPDVGPMNFREGALLEAMDALKHRVGFSGNRDIAGFANVASDRAAGFIGALLDRSPAAKSLLGRGLYQAAARAARVPENLLRLAMTAIAQSPDEAPAETPVP